MTASRMTLLVAAGTAAMILLEGILVDAKPFPGFHAVLGFTSCVAVVVASKLLGRLGLQRPEDPHED